MLRSLVTYIRISPLMPTSRDCRISDIHLKPVLSAYIYSLHWHCAIPPFFCNLLVRTSSYFANNGGLYSFALVVTKHPCTIYSVIALAQFVCQELFMILKSVNVWISQCSAISNTYIVMTDVRRSVL